MCDHFNTLCVLGSFAVLFTEQLIDVKEYAYVHI